MVIDEKDAMDIKEACDMLGRISKLEQVVSDLHKWLKVNPSHPIQPPAEQERCKSCWWIRDDAGCNNFVKCIDGSLFKPKVCKTCGGSKTVWNCHYYKRQHQVGECFKIPCPDCQPKEPAILGVCKNCIGLQGNSKLCNNSVDGNADCAYYIKPKEPTTTTSTSPATQEDRDKYCEPADKKYCCRCGGELKVKYRDGLYYFECRLQNIVGTHYICVGGFNIESDCIAELEKLPEVKK